MPNDTDIIVSQLPTASAVNASDLVMLTQENSQAETGYDTKKATFENTAKKIVHGIEYETLLANFPQNKRNPTDAVEYVRDFLISQLPVNQASGSIANFNTSLALPLVSGKFEIPYDANGYTGMNIGYVDFNQLVENGNFADTSIWKIYLSTQLSVANNEATIDVSSGTTTGVIFSDKNAISNHVYLATLTAKCNTATSVMLRLERAISTNKTTSSTTYETLNIIGKANTATYDNIRYNITVAGAEGSGMVKNAMLIDLTAMFGSTIADYIYSLEQSTAGAGVALFRQIFYKDYYAYNAGGTKVSVDSVNGEPTCPNAQITFGQTIYGGEFDSVTGKLTSKYNADGTEKATPDIIDLEPVPITPLVGKNNIWCDTNGNAEVEYKQGIQEYIDAKIAETQALIL